MPSGIGTLGRLASGRRRGVGVLLPPSTYAPMSTLPRRLPPLPLRLATNMIKPDHQTGHRGRRRDGDALTDREAEGAADHRSRP